MGKETKNLMLEVSAGIVFFTVAVMLGAFFVYPRRAVYAGLILGMVLALAMFLSMALVLERSMKTEDPKTVQKQSIISAVLRYLLLIVIMIVVIERFSDWFNPVAVVIGVLGLKAGAFFQPIIHKIAVRRAKGE
ncbi:MAG TPA: ATP synthase subunit I [Lachnoclostridium sp.]|jgi:small-conductance mechanosensitive channel|uniref:ATP synthase subunit I n=1 Tax=Lacrimispora sp. TaxID=2719234 RepID=UPI000EC952F9|nr:ATP synthase subunit I [Lacrimispora sp.]HCD42605.1 ATP synthase subunit I [Lachnoclostridium sp.]